MVKQDKIDIMAYFKILEYLIEIDKRKESGATKHRIGKEAFPQTVKNDKWIQTQLDFLIKKNWVDTITTADKNNYYKITESGREFYLKKLYDLISSLRD